MTEPAALPLPEGRAETPARPTHPLVAVGLGIVVGLLLARLIRR